MEQQAIIIGLAAILAIGVLFVLVLVVAYATARIKQDKHNRERDIFKQKEMREFIEEHNRRNRGLDLIAATNRTNRG